MKTFFVVVAIIKNNDKILLLRKSMTDKNYPGKWGFCAGFAKEFEPAETGVLREIKEETGLDAEIMEKGKVIEIVDKKNDKAWIIMPFLCSVKSQEVKLCNENMEYAWIKKKELKNYDCVPDIEKDLKSFNL